MRKRTLPNGARLIFEDRKTDSVSIFVTVEVGSIHESDHNRGISHFIEHMVFEGTATRTAQEIANAVKSLGGTIGAYTSAERTCYYVKLLKKHISEGVDILEDILLNPSFELKTIEKEREVILSEVKMKEDEPRFYQWSLFSRSLFRKFPLKHPVIGYTDTIKAITRDDIIAYFKKHYIAPNMIVSVVGDVKGMESRIAATFRKLPDGRSRLPRITKEPFRDTGSHVTEKRPIKQTYLVLGYLAPTRDDPDSYVFDVIHAILGRGMSGRLFEEMRTKRGLGYDVGSHYADNKYYGFFAAYAALDGKSLGLAKRIILEQMRSVDGITPEELSDAKNFIEGDFMLHNEDTENLADTIGFYEHVGDAKMMKDYIRNIRKVTISDISRIKKKYLKKDNYTLAIIGQK